MTEHKEAPQNELNERIDSLGQPEEKLKALMEFMEAKLSTSSAPQFKPFWEAREKCIELFKQVENPMVRSQLWSKYSDLSKEARRLKELLDEESAFNIEQIELAIQALEAELGGLDEAINNAPSVELPAVHAIHADYSMFEAVQRELNFLNAYASRIHALRKELIKTEMRIKVKNKFFERLSTLGDALFPRRKTLIDEVSSKFEEDVKLFVEKYFKDGNNESPFFLKDEIKGLQGIAKILTLSTHAFKETRLVLSECWDKLKVQEKEHKKVKAELKEQFKANCQMLMEKLAGIKAKYEAKELTVNHANEELNHFQQEMRNTELGRDEVKALREEVANVRDVVEASLREEEEERNRQELIREQERKERVLNFKNQILELINSASGLDVVKIQERQLEIQTEILASNLNRHEKQELEKGFKPLKEILADKQEEKLLNLSADDREALTSLTEVLTQRKLRRQEVKDKLDEIRKKAGSSNLDFSKQIAMNEQIQEEKERLEKLNEGIKEIEVKISKLKK